MGTGVTVRLLCGMNTSLNECNCLHVMWYGHGCYSPLVKWYGHECNYLIVMWYGHEFNCVIVMWYGHECNCPLVIWYRHGSNCQLVMWYCYGCNCPLLMWYMHGCNHPRVEENQNISFLGTCICVSLVGKNRDVFVRNVFYFILMKNKTNVSENAKSTMFVFLRDGSFTLYIIRLLFRVNLSHLVLVEISFELPYF